MRSRGNKPLKRRAAKRSAKRHFYIFCEGEKTERDYFNALEATLDAKETKIVYNGPLGVPKTVAAKAIAFAQDKGLVKGRRGKKLNSFEENDEVWTVFDRDAFPCYGEAKQMCDGAGISYAYSDPCFEHWINLHLGSHDAPCSRHEAQAKTKELIGDYDPDAGKTADFSTLMGSLPDAEDRAKRQRASRRDEGNLDGNPSTNVDKLTRRLRNIKDE